MMASLNYKSLFNFGTILYQTMSTAVIIYNLQYNGDNFVVKATDRTI